MDEGHILTMADGEKCKNGEDSGPVGMLIEAINEIFDIPAPKVPFGSFILSATYLCCDADVSFGRAMIERSSFT